MARKLRFERAGALYHVLNRGNFQFDVFASEGARHAFLRCLAEACGRAGWVVHAWAVMINHFHLALETPEPNLVAGMQWLLTTFCARYNRFRSVQGHVFQGRYKAFPAAQGEPFGALCHYIHLNPVEAHLLTVEQLRDFPWTSYHQIHLPAARPAWLNCDVCLQNPCGLTDDPAGRARYGEYLTWLAENDAEKKRLRFEGMSVSWALGPADFKRVLLKQLSSQGVALPYGSREHREATELTWDLRLDQLLALVTPAERSNRAKSADWKVAIAAVMKRQTTASNAWLASRLGMGAPSMVSHLVAQCLAGLRASSLHQRLTSNK